MDHLETGIDAAACQNTLSMHVKINVRLGHSCVCHRHHLRPTGELRPTGKTVKSLKNAWQEAIGGVRIQFRGTHGDQLLRLG